MSHLSLLCLSPLLSPTLSHMANLVTEYLSTLAWINFTFLKLDKRVIDSDFLDTTKYPAPDIILLLI